MKLAALKKVRRREKIADTSLQPVDLVLAGVASALALYAVNVSIAADANGIFFGIVVAIGAFTSFLILQFFGNTKLILFDTKAYPLAAIVLAFTSTGLGSFLPNDVFQEQLAVPGTLCWMLAIGSFFVWRDQTMLFQAVPGVALFGLVGCYDTFPNAIFLFFGFIICQALLLGRANSRLMLRQASAIERRDLSLTDMRRGVWKWMAGPEWALASGLAVVVISLLGAPLLRQSASSISGIIQYSPAIPVRNQPSVLSDSASGVRVGGGPRNLDNTPVFRATLPEYAYLRTSTMNFYELGRWFQRSSTAPTPPERDPTTVHTSRGDIDTRNLGVVFNRDRREMNFSVEPVGRVRGTIPAPGETIWIEDSSRFTPDSGGFTYSGYRRPYPSLSGIAITFGNNVPYLRTVPASVSGIDYWSSARGIDPAVQDFARKATAGAKNDQQKAIMLMRAIEKQSTYDLNAEAVPANVDPVRYFLIESKRGYCDLFASSMVLSARSVGLTARYVTGYLPSPDDREENGRYIIRSKYAHAWAEILFDGAGWVIFDPTEGAAMAEGDDLGSVPKAFWERPWFYIPALLAFLTMLIFGVLRTWDKIKLYYSRERRQARKVKGIQDRLQRRAGAEVRRFESRLGKECGLSRNASETLRQFVNRATATIGKGKQLAAEPLAAFTQVLYGSDGWTDDKITALKEANRRLAVELKESGRR